MSDEKEFKVVDKRGAPKEEKTEPVSKGEKFVMKDAPSAAPPAAHDQLDFSTLVLSFATSALINLGVAPDPSTKRVTKNIELARQNIEILNLLKEKSKGNLTEDEKELLESLLTETKLRFVEASK